MQLRFDAIDRMCPEIIRGLGALKRRGLEVGGLLLGRAEPGFPQQVTIEDFEPVPTEYLNGPSYNLSPNDLVAFEAALQRWQSGPHSRLSVVGFYRSHTRDDLYMDEADLALASRYFPNEPQVFLIVKPFASRTSIAGFFFWEDGEISRQSSYLEFPFNRTELGGGQPRAVLSPVKLPVERGERAEQPVDFEEDPWPAIRQSNLSILSQPPEPSPILASKRWLLAPVFLLLAGFAAFFGYQNLSESKPLKPAQPIVAGTTLPLKLSVAEKQDQLDVTWDRNAAAIATARHGVLSISDGSNRRDLELTGAQLRNGRVLYSRLSGDVGLRLEVFPDIGDSVSESIRIVLSDPIRRPALSGSPPSFAQTPAPVPAAPVETARKQESPPAPPKPAVTETPARAPSAPAPRATAPVEARSAAKRAAAKTAAPIPEAEPDVELERPTRRR